MVRLVWEATNDISVLEQALPVLEQEYRYWTTAPKAVPVAVNDTTTFAFSRYYADWDQPRPESYLCVMLPLQAMRLTVSCAKQQDVHYKEQGRCFFPPQMRAEVSNVE